MILKRQKVGFLFFSSIIMLLVLVVGTNSANAGSQGIDLQVNNGIEIGTNYGMTTTSASTGTWKTLTAHGTNAKVVAKVKVHNNNIVAVEPTATVYAKSSVSPILYVEYAKVKQTGLRTVNISAKYKVGSPLNFYWETVNTNHSIL